jgi:phospholipid/cholesterol/gamma-HCH transport system ATP-binding protein
MVKKIALEMRNATVELGHKEILKNINLQVFEGERVVLIGPSGGGKTVLIKAMAGVYPPTKGEILIEGEDWKSLESDEKHELARKLGMLFQRSALFDTLTTLENVEFPIREHYDFEEEKIHRIAKDLLAKVNLSDSHHKLPSELSGGMQRRLGIARALALNPSIVFYDDPVAGQDPIQTYQMLELIMDFKTKHNSTLLISTSSMKVAYKIADRIIMVVDESIIDCGSPEQTKKHPDPRVQQFIHGEVEGPIKEKF